ncbi:MAG TPA: ChbG/HpnK family deacetylase [Rhabdaerophilum sp.]|nr:ChbG/HpnK family deacetylase [Rhabdaerophilum sp.]
MPAPRLFVLCADDYGMTPAVSRGILRLVEAGRISATGSMTNMPAWKTAAHELWPHDQKIDLGVHLNLTCGRPLTAMKAFAPEGEFPRLPAIVARGLAGRLPLGEIEAELSAQLTEFEDSMGRTPDFIDGHQHVHAMPGVRRALAAVVARRYPAAKPYIRDAVDRLAAIRARKVQSRKAMIVAGLARPFAAGIAPLGFRLNEGFSGYSAFDPRADYAAAFPSYLVEPGAKPLVMCHPGEIDDELRRLDPAIESRPQEIAYFLSGAFTEACEQAGMQPARFSAL